MFTAALRELDASGAPVSQPESFTEYCQRTFQPVPKDVPSRISVQTLSSLDAGLRHAGVMIYRLGSPPGTRTTHFALARTVGGWSDYFLIDREVFASIDTQAFIPTASNRELYAFSLIPRFTETTLVNFALASGLLAEALKIDDSPSIPVTGRSTYTFSFHPRLPQDATWTHHAGQVEIDGVFTARRNGRDTLFIVEAKHGVADSLSKTKLFYPYLALRPHVPDNMPIALIYLRATTSDRIMTYNIAECTPPSWQFPSPIDMTVQSACSFSVTAPGSEQ